MLVSFSNPGRSAPRKLISSGRLLFGLLISLLGSPSFADIFTLDLLPARKYDSLSAAESAMRAIPGSLVADLVQYEVKETPTQKFYYYYVPPKEPFPNIAPTQTWSGSYSDAISACQGIESPDLAAYSSSSPDGSLSCARSVFKEAQLLESYYSDDLYYQAARCYFKKTCTSVLYSQTTTYTYEHRLRPESFADVAIEYICPTNYTLRNGTCVPDVRCPDRYTYVSTRNKCMAWLNATITQTFTTTCSIPDLTALTDQESLALEANPIDTDRLTGETKSALNCLNGKIEGYGVPPNITSAFRTETYQQHLYEIYDRWMERGLIDDASPECAELKQKVGNEWNRHGLEGLKTAPASSAGKHPQGLAFDLSRRSTVSQLEAMKVDIRRMAEECGLDYPLPVKDRGHFELK